jgi:hypothetical protein
MNKIELNKYELQQLLIVVKEQSIFPATFRSDNMLKFINQLETQIKNN